MRVRPVAPVAIVIAAGLLGAVGSDPVPPETLAVPSAEAAAADVTQGALRVQGKDGRLVECPLRHTDVQAEVSGFLARVRVVQTFENPYDEPIEAVYVFPLPHTAAVDAMTLVVGERRVVGVIKRRAEARRIYARALQRGFTAGLLEQERPNIFTQSVGNIPPRQSVRVEIAYVDALPYDLGAYEFHFPMVVGPRYIPGAPISRPPDTPDELTGRVAAVEGRTGAGVPSGTGWAPDTTRVPDASRITPRVLRPGLRNGHDIALRVSVEAGVPIRGLSVPSHTASIQRQGRSRAEVLLDAADSIPNKDFVLTYKVAGDKPEVAVLAHAPEGDDGYFLLMLQPRDMEDALRQAPPRDLCFLIDVSGSMSGEPTQKVKETLERFFERTQARDRLQVVTFAGSAQKLFPGYVPATAANVAQALQFARGLEGSGGTEMMEGIRQVLSDPLDPQRVRIVVMLTDGFIGNESEIIGEVGRRAGDLLRFWTIGIGSSPNRYLLDGVARVGGGTSAVIGLNDDPQELVGRIVERIHRAQLTAIELDWGGLEVHSTYPARLPELWSGRPVVVFGRYRDGADITLTLSGRAEGHPASFPVAVSLPGREPGHAVLANVWARRKIESLSDELAVQGAGEDLVEEITEIALRYRLMSAYTSFVAVDEAERQSLEEARPPRRMLVPVPLPDGVSFEGVFGRERGMDEALEIRASKAAGRARKRRWAAVAPLAAPPAVAEGVGGGVPGGVVGGVVGGLPASAQATLASPYDMSVLASRPVMDTAVVADRKEVERLHAQAPALQREASEALAQARTHKQTGELEAARARLRLAWVLAEAAAAAQPWAADDTRDRLLDEWNDLTRLRLEAATKALPSLGRRLDIVVRNADIEAALQSIAKAAGFGWRMTPEATADAAQAVGRPSLRVAYLDLRRATAAQALEWLLEPNALEWRVAQGRIVVDSARRGAGAEAWTRRDTLLPSITGTGSVAQALHTIERFSWRLLAAAHRGNVDDEAVSELIEAWAVPGVAEALATRERVLAARVLHAVAQARAVTPGDLALAALAKATEPVAGRLVASDDPVTAIYLRLAGTHTDVAQRPISGAFAPVAQALFAGAHNAEAILAAVQGGQLAGDDPVYLAALALQKRGGPEWARFRHELSDLAPRARLSGPALRVLNRLEERRRS